MLIIEFFLSRFSCFDLMRFVYSVLDFLPKSTRKMMLGGPGGDDPDANKRMADLQVKSSFIQFVIAVGLINLGRMAVRQEMGNRTVFAFSSIRSGSGHG
jgi:hypothetical protein